MTTNEKRLTAVIVALVLSIILLSAWGIQQAGKMKDVELKLWFMQGMPSE